MDHLLGRHSGHCRDSCFGVIETVVQVLDQVVENEEKS